MTKPGMFKARGARTAFRRPPPLRRPNGWFRRVFIYYPFTYPYSRLGTVARALVLSLIVLAGFDPLFVAVLGGLAVFWLLLLPFAYGKDRSRFRRTYNDRLPEQVVARAVYFILLALLIVVFISVVGDQSGEALNITIAFAFLKGVMGSLAATMVGAIDMYGEPEPQRASHGSARLMGDLGHLVTGKGLLIGRAGQASAYQYRGQVLTNPDPRHMVTVAANGAGKGVSAIVPNLLTYGGSMLAIDPKGELAAITGRTREARGQNVYTLDPWGLSGRPSASFNPLSILTEDNPDIVEDAALITDALVFDDGGSDPYWNLEARNLLQGLILHIATDYAIPDEERTLLKLRELLTLDVEGFDTLLEEMRTNIGANGAVSRIAGALSAMAEKQFSSIRSTARVSTDFLESPRMARVLERTDFALTELKTRPTTIYLCLPAARLGTHNRWLRLMIGLALEAMERERTRPAEPVVFLMDEFATLGYMRSIENAVGQIRGFGVQLWPVLQDLNQLKALYRDRWETFLGNAGTVQFFGINDQFTAQYVSRVLGEQTIYVTSRSSTSGPQSSSTSVSTSERGRALLTSDEVRRLPMTQQIVLMQGQPGLLADKLRYYDDPEFEGLFDENPLHG